LLVAVATLGLLACDDPASPEQVDARADAQADKAARKAARELAKAERATEIAAEAQARAVKAVAVADLMAVRAEMIGQTVKVSGIYTGSETKGAVTHVTVATAADEGAASLTCMAEDAAAFADLSADAEVVVQGVFLEEEGVVRISDCTRVP
ncbi:MAG: hypothetical protein AAF211_06415, partial [Myxococcota bacterium]